MLMEAKNQVKVNILSLKYNIIKQMINKVTFIANIIAIILYDASFIIEWVVLFNLKDEIGGYTIKEMVLLLGIATSVLGVSHLLFNGSYKICDLIANGKLDSFIVQPKNILLNVLSSDIRMTSIGDLIYGYACLIIYGINIKTFILFTFFSLTGGIIVTALICIIQSLSFWMVKDGDVISSLFGSAMIFFSTYPGRIFNGIVKIILFTIIPVGFANYLPVETIIDFNFMNFIYIMGFTVFITILAFAVFYRGLKRYSSSNLMVARI